MGQCRPIRRCLRLVTTLAQAGLQALRTIHKARPSARARVWELAGEHAPGTGGDLIPEHLDTTIVPRTLGEEECNPDGGSTPSGFHPMTAFIDHGPGGTVEAAALVLGPDNAGSNTAADTVLTSQPAGLSD